MASNNRDVSLRIRAKDETGPGLRSAQSALDRLAAAQKRTQARRDQYGGAVQATRDLRQAYDDAAAAAEKVGQRMAAAQRPSRKLKDEFAASRTAAREAKQAYLDAEKALGAMQGRRGGGFTAFDQMASGMERQKAQAASLARSQEQAARATDRLGDALAQVAAYQQRKARFAAFDEIASSGDRAKMAAIEVNRELNKVAETNKSKSAAAQVAASAEGRAALEVANALRAEHNAAQALAAAEQHLFTIQRSGTATAAQLVAAHRRLATAHNEVTAAAQQSAAVQKRVTKGDLAGNVVSAWSSRNGRGPLGLRPYEMTNLGYQINDVVSGLAMGQRPMQVFAQQAGQIAQIFPAATGAILRFIPVVGLAAVALSPFVANMVKANNEASRLSSAEAILQRSGNAALYSAPQLAEFAKRLEDIGVKGKDTSGILSTFVRDAVDPSYLETFARASQGLAKAMGGDLAAASEKVSSTFTGNVDAILSLDDELKFLTATERAHIQALKDAGKESEARTTALDIFADRYATVSSDMDGPWTASVKNLTSAWEGFVNFVNFIDWSKVKGELNGLIGLVEKLTRMLPGARTATYAATTRTIGDIENQRLNRIQQINEANSRQGVYARGTDSRRNNAVREARQAIAGFDRELALLRSRQDEQRPAAEEPRSSDTTTRPDAPAATRTARSGRTRESEAEKLAKKQAEFLAMLAEETETRQFQLGLLDETERRQLVLTALRQAETAAAKVGLTLTEEQRRSIENGTTAIYDRQKALEAAKIIDQSRLELAEKRGEVEARDAFIARRLEAEMKDAREDQKADYREILGQFYDMEESKRRQSDLEEQIATQEAIRAELLSQMEAAANAGDLTRVAQIQEQLVGVNANLLTAVQNLIRFWEEAGGPKADLALLKLRAWEKALKEGAQQAVVTGKQIDDMIAQGGAQAFDSFFKELSEGANAFDALRVSFGQFAADFMRQIAQMIIQQAILNALGGGGPGGSVNSGGIAGFVNGLFRHSGGLVGSGGGFGPVNPAVFAGAMRYHSGGLAGLAPDEVPAILLRNEEVLTEDDPRHRNNGGLSGKSITAKIVNMIDSGDMLSQGLETEAGEQSIMNFIGRNAGAIKARLG